MKSKLVTLALLSTLSLGAFAQALESTTAVIISPTVSVLRTLAAITDSVAGTLATGSLVSLGSTVGTIEAKGVNDKKAMNNEANQAYAALQGNQELKLGNFKALSNMIDELKNNEETADEINARAQADNVSFETIALGAILVSTEN